MLDLQKFLTQKPLRWKPIEAGIVPLQLPLGWLSLLLEKLILEFLICTNLFFYWQVPRCRTHGVK